MRDRRRTYWACQLIGWLAAAATNLLLATLGRGPVPWQYALTFSGGALAAVAVTHGYRAVIRGRRWIALPLGRLVPRMVVASFVVGTAITIVATPVWLIVFGDGISPLGVWAPPAILSWSWMVFVWSVLYFGIHYFERWRQSEVEKLQLALVAKDAQLQGLIAQLQPHFLFNCLNSVRALIVEDPAKAQAAVTGLSALMRYSLQATRAATVPLATEIEMVRTYLGLEAVRFEERLIADVAIDSDTTELHVPPMLVQSLVENGVKHGIERSPHGGTIRIASWREAGALRIRVSNPGTLEPSGDSTRIGLANSRDRLRLLFGADASLALHDRERTVVADVTIPLGATT